MPRYIKEENMAAIEAGGGMGGMPIEAIVQRLEKQLAGLNRRITAFEGTRKELMEAGAELMQEVAAIVSGPFKPAAAIGKAVAVLMKTNVEQYNLVLIELKEQREEIHAALEQAKQQSSLYKANLVIPPGRRQA